MPYQTQRCCPSFLSIFCFVFGRLLALLIRHENQREITFQTDANLHIIVFIVYIDMLLFCFYLPYLEMTALAMLGTPTVWAHDASKIE